jgi:hypothetical protein
MEFFTVTVIGLILSMVVLLVGFLQQPRARPPSRPETAHLVRTRHLGMARPTQARATSHLESAVTQQV